MLPSLSGLRLNDEEPTGVPGGITKARDKRNLFKQLRREEEARAAAANREAAQRAEALKRVYDDWEEAESDEAARQAYANEEARRTPSPVHDDDPAPLPAASLAAERERNEAVQARDSEAAARRVAEQARDQAQQTVQELESVRAWQQAVIDAGTRNLNEQSKVIEEGEKAQAALISRAINAEARAEAAERANDPMDTNNDANASPPLPDQGNGANAPPPYRGDRSLLQPSTDDDRIAELRRYLVDNPAPAEIGASPDFRDVLPMGFERLMKHAFIKRGSRKAITTAPRKDQSPAALEQYMLEKRHQAWKAFTDARDAVLTDKVEMDRWRRLRTTNRSSGIELEHIRWDTEKYLKGGFIDYAASKEGGNIDALKYFKNAKEYPAIKEDLYKALQERQRTDGKTIILRTEKVQAVYEAALTFCQADLKYEVTLARKRTWAALYTFLEEEMLEKWPEGGPTRTPEGELAPTREELWEHAFEEAHKKLPCFPPDSKAFERLQLLMEAQVTNNIQWQYPYYNAYELSRDDGIFGKEFKFRISRGPTMSLVAKRGDRSERTYHIQHVHIPWEWMKVFLDKNATKLAQGLGDFCGSRFLVDEEYEEVKEAHDLIKPDAPEALRTLPDPRITETAPLTIAEHRRLDSTLSNRGFDEASRGAQLTLGTMHSNNNNTSADPLSIGQNRRFGSMVPEHYEFCDPYIEERAEGWTPDPDWEPPVDWRVDLGKNRKNTFLRLHKKYWAYVKHEKYAKNFIGALEASEESLYVQAWNERLLVGNLLDPKKCLRNTPERKTFAFSLTSGFSVAPHDDSGAALEHIVFTYPAHAELPLGHNPMFVASGIIMMLPGPVDKGPPGNELAGIRACLCTVPGHGVNHGSMPTWKAEFYKAAEKAGELATLTLPRHFKCGSALITKVVPQMLSQRSDKEGNYIEFDNCKGVIDKLNPLYANNPNMDVDKLRQLLYEGNKLGRGDGKDTEGKVWSFDVRSQWLASYTTEASRKKMKEVVKQAYAAVYTLSDKEKKAMEEEEARKAKEAKDAEEEAQKAKEEARKAKDAKDAEEEGDDSDDGGDSGNDGGSDGGSAPGPEGGRDDSMDDDESNEAPTPSDRVLSNDSHDSGYNVPVDQPPIAHTPLAQASSSVAPMDVEGDGATTPPPQDSSGSAQMPSSASRRLPGRIRKPAVYSGMESSDKDVNVNGQTMKDPFYYIDDIDLGDPLERERHREMRKSKINSLIRALNRTNSNQEQEKAKERLAAARQSEENAERLYAEYDAQHGQ